ncbi:hypothetical protein [Phenylobacterium sp.]|uniref:hypothetical protein n=1 Tax=Phenylobacterium sp. TaxID=1871053 RepID=UPI002737171C|nr:hypothetical protein [Phenylobacterium sp.]MDP3660070.1 hypothetical protein [Phenylobacterium sp.]
MSRAGLSALAALALGACGSPPQTPSTRPAFVLDCDKGFAVLSARIAADPDLVKAPATPGEPYDVYNATDGHASFFVTQKAAPGHPAIVMQQPERVGGKLDMKNTGCPYGQRKGYDELITYLEIIGRVAAPAQNR